MKNSQTGRKSFIFNTRSAIFIAVRLSGVDDLIGHGVARFGV